MSPPRSAPPGPVPLRQTFLVFGDSGTGDDHQAAVTARMAAEPACDFVLHTGDLGYPSGRFGDLKENYLAAYAGLMCRAAFLPCPGNHEYMTFNGRPYRQLRLGADPASTYYTVRMGPLQIFSIDSNAPLDGPPESNPMLAWLDRELRLSRSFWRIAIFHHTPYTNSSHASDPLVERARTLLAPLLESYAVPCVFTGHEHLYQRSHPLRSGVVVPAREGTVYITAGGGGGPLYDFAAHPLIACGQRAWHYVRATVEGPRMTLAAVDVGGSEFDQVVIAPAPVARRAVNAVNFQPALAPGSLAVVRGWHLACDGSVRVACDDRLIDLCSASPVELRFTIPEEAAACALVRIDTANGSSTLEVPLQETAPAVTEPDPLRSVRAGSSVSLLATGLGRSDGAQPLQPVAVLFDEMSLTAAVTPAEPRGLWQVSFQVPDDTPAGHYPLQLRCGAALSPAVSLSIAGRQSRTTSLSAPR